MIGFGRRTFVVRMSCACMAPVFEDGDYVYVEILGCLFRSNDVFDEVLSVRRPDVCAAI